MVMVMLMLVMGDGDGGDDPGDTGSDDDDGSGHGGGDDKRHDGDSNDKDDVIMWFPQPPPSPFLSSLPSSLSSYNVGMTFLNGNVYAHCFFSVGMKYL